MRSLQALAVTMAMAMPPTPMVTMMPPPMMGVSGITGAKGETKVGHIRIVHNRRRNIIWIIDYGWLCNTIWADEEAERDIAPSHRSFWPEHDQHGQPYHQSNHRFSHRIISFLIHFVVILSEVMISCFVFKAIGIPDSEVSQSEQRDLLKYLILLFIIVI